MESKQNPLQNYNTEAFVPGNDSMPVMSETLADNANGAMAQESAAQTRVEPLQGPSTTQPDTISTLNQKTPTAPLNDLSGQNWQSGANSASPDMQKTKNPYMQKHKNRAKTITILAILATALILGIGIAVVWMTISNGSDSGSGGYQSGAGVPNGEVVELSLDNALVQRLYHNFDVVGEPYSSTMDFYSNEGVRNGNLDKALMTDIALRSTRKYSNYCRGLFEYREDYPLFAGDAGCYVADDVKLKVKEIFGKDVTYENGDGTGGYCGSYQYNAENDEFFIPAAGCGGSCFLYFERALDGAERKGNDIYLYETVYGNSCDGVSHTNGDPIASRIWSENGELLFDPNPEDYADQLEHYKWTFTKSADGDYVFAGLEKINS